MGLLTPYWAEYSKYNVLLWGCKVSEGIDVPCLGMNPLLFYRRMHCNIAQSSTLGFLCSWHRHSLYRCGHLCWQQSIVMLLDSAVHELIGRPHSRSAGSKKALQHDASSWKSRLEGCRGYTDFYTFFITLLPISLQLSWQVCCGDNTAIQLQNKFWIPSRQHVRDQGALFFVGIIIFQLTAAVLRCRRCDYLRKSNLSKMVTSWVNGLNIKYGISPRDIFMV